MLSGLSSAILLLLAISSPHTAGQHCRCSALLPAGLQVNCSSSNLMVLPALPSDTTELNVQDNQLTSVSPGLFDNLVGLTKVSLSGNPFHCDSRIQYLRNWLRKNRAIVPEEPTCASPTSVAQKAITELSDDHFSSYSLASCTNETIIMNTIIGVMLCCLIILLLWNLRLAKMSTFTLYIDERHSGFEADSLRSPRHKHRRRLHTALSQVGPDSLTYAGELQQQRTNMDLLPQVLDVLHKKHNIKIKAT